MPNSANTANGKVSSNASASWNQVLGKFAARPGTRDQSLPDFAELMTANYQSSNKEPSDSSDTQERTPLSTERPKDEGASALASTTASPRVIKSPQLPRQNGSGSAAVPPSSVRNRHDTTSPDAATKRDDTTDTRNNKASDTAQAREDDAGTPTITTAESHESTADSANTASSDDTERLDDTLSNLELVFASLISITQPSTVLQHDARRTPSGELEQPTADVALTDGTVTPDTSLDFQHISALAGLNKEALAPEDMYDGQASLDLDLQATQAPTTITAEAPPTMPLSVEDLQAVAMEAPRADMEAPKTTSTSLSEKAMSMDVLKKDSSGTTTVISSAEASTQAAYDIHPISDKNQGSAFTDARDQNKTTTDAGQNYSPNAQPQSNSIDAATSFLLPTTGSAATALTAATTASQPAASTPSDGIITGAVLDTTKSFAIYSAQGTSASQRGNIPHTPTAVEQVVMHIARTAKSGDNQISLQLNPNDLGQVTIKLDVSKNGSVTGTVVADNPETLAALIKDQRSLERALNDSGLRTDSGSLHFSLGQQPGQSGHNAQSQHAGNSTTQNKGEHDILTAEDGSTRATDEHYVITSSRINIQV